MIKRSVVREKFGDLTYFSISSSRGAAVPAAKGSVYLLPNYDEYLIAYRDRGQVPQLPIAADAPRGFDVYAHLLVVDGTFAGTWRKVERADVVQIAATPFEPLKRVNVKALATQADRMAAFLGVKTGNQEVRRPATTMR